MLSRLVIYTARRGAACRAIKPSPIMVSCRKTFYSTETPKSSSTQSTPTHAKSESTKSTPTTDHPIVSNDTLPKEKGVPKDEDKPQPATSEAATTATPSSTSTPTPPPSTPTPAASAASTTTPPAQPAASSGAAAAAATSGTPEPTGPPPPTYENVIAERRGKVGVIKLNRPKQLNALSDSLVRDIQSALFYFQDDKTVGAMVLIGSEKAFAAGADIKEMSTKSFMDAYKSNMLAQWQDLNKIRKPVIAAVSGFALGGGCELAMLCDMIIASENAMFGQPEVQLGTIPGCGGTQRLVRAVGKSKAMELILTGNQMTAKDAELAGLVSRVVPLEKLLEESVRIATKIASYSHPIIAMAKEAVNAAYEMELQQGLAFERRMFHSTFATQDQTEGMMAFREKRQPNWTHE